MNLRRVKLKVIGGRDAARDQASYRRTLYTNEIGPLEGEKKKARLEGFFPGLATYSDRGEMMRRMEPEEDRGKIFEVGLG